VALPRAPQRLGDDVDPHHLRPRFDELGGKAPLAAADVEQPFARTDVAQEEVATQREVDRLQALRNRFPESLVVVLARGHRSAQG